MSSKITLIASRILLSVSALGNTVIKKLVAFARLRVFGQPQVHMPSCTSIGRAAVVDFVVSKPIVYSSINPFIRSLNLRRELLLPLHCIQRSSIVSRFTFGILFGLFATCSFAQHGVGPQWGPEVALPLHNPSASQRGVLFNNMAVSTRGRVFISTVELNPVTQTVLGNYLTYSDDGMTWQAPRAITGMSRVAGASSPKLVMYQDELIVMFSGSNPAALYCLKYDTTLTPLSDTIRIASPTWQPKFSSTHLTVDGRNRLHAIWHEGNMEAGQIVESFTCRSTDGGLSWSQPIRLSNLDGLHSAFPRGQFEGVFGDTLAIAWRDSALLSSNKWDIQMAVSTNGGISWSLPITVVATSNFESDPDIVLDSGNRIHLFYHQYPSNNPFWGANIRYRRSDNLGVSWSTEQQLSSPGGNIRSHLVEGDRYDVQRNVLWCMWKDERDFFQGQTRADIVVSYSTNNGVNWSTPEFATDWDSLSVAFKAAALLPNGTYITNYEVMPTVANGPIRVYYRQRSSVPSSVVSEQNVATDVWLGQNYPNPFNATSVIKYGLPKNSYVTLKLYDILGREIKVMVDGMMMEGVHEVSLDASELASGMYLYELKAGEFHSVKKLLLLK